MKKIIAIFICISFLSIGKSQNIKGFVALGTNISQIDGDEIVGFKHWGLHGGVGAMMSLGKKSPWHFNIETLLSQKGSIQKNVYAVDLTYAEIPVLICLEDKKGGFTFGAGISYARLIETKEKPSLHFIDTTSSFRNDNLCILGDIRFTIWKQLKFNFRYQYSLIPIRKNWIFTDQNGKSWSRNAYDHSLTFRLLWVFNENTKSKKYKRR